MGGTFRTICVRTCDGFYFPISFATTPDRFRDDEQTCQRMCPAAEVSLYTYHNPGEEVAQAVSLNGRLYTELPTAFSYRKALNPACSCRRPGESWAEALKANGADDTVAPGDVVVTEQNAKQLSQPRIGADGKPIRPDPRAKAIREPAPDCDRGSAGRDRSGQAQSAHSRPDIPAGAVIPLSCPTSRLTKACIDLKIEASVLAGLPVTSDVSGAGSGVPGSRKRLVIG